MPRAAAPVHAALLDGGRDGGEVRGNHPGRVPAGLDPEGGPDPRLADPLLLVFQHDPLHRVEDGDPAKSSQRSSSNDIVPVASNAASSMAEYASLSISSPVKSSKTANRSSDRSKKVRIPSGSRSLYAPAYRSRKPCASNAMIHLVGKKYPPS